MRWRLIIQILVKEFLQLVRSPALVFLMVACPVIVVGVVPLGLSNKTRLRVEVVDESFSSRGLEAVKCLSGSPQIAQVRQSASLQASERRMDLGEIDGIVVVSDDGGGYRILADASTLILGRDVAYYVGRQLSGVQEDERVRSHILFQSDSGNTHYYLVTMLALLISIMGCCLATLSVVTEKESKALEHLRSTGMSASLYVFSKVLFFTLAGLVELGLGLIIARVCYSLVCAGAVWEYFVLAACFLFAIVNLGIWVAVGTRTLVRAVYVLVFVFITLILLSTMFAPLDNMMPFWAATRFINPFFWIADGSWKIVLEGIRLSAMPGHCLALVGMGSVMAFINIKKIKQID
jgi:ABC-2 type transport system permease protein